MMSKFFVTVLAFFMLTTYTHAAAGTGLKQAFDEFNYAVKVEWDQKDQAFYNAQLEKLKAAVSAAQTSGMSNAALIDAIAAETKSTVLRDELRLLATQVELGLIAQDQLQAEVQKVMSKSYRQGASWNGEAILLGAVGVLVVVLLVAYVSCVTDPNSVTVCDDYVYCDTWDDYCEVGRSCGCSN